MAMDFFEHQETARRKTGRLVILFGLAVAGIILSVYAVVTLGLGYAGTKTSVDVAPSPWQWEVFLVTALCVLLVVGLGSMYKIAQLNAGGAAVARMVGATPVSSSSKSTAERRLLNVVEEMAIASGTPVPAVYLMAHEPGINAFAAGHSPDDAVIGVTQGCLEQLDRDELQGVIAHEFSHVLNGDMRLNLRLMGVVHGILVIGIIGYILLRTAHGGRRNPLPLIGLALLVIGYLGTFFGNLIKAGVSRQREFLADASAVQFTRNPGGIAGALRKIGGHSTGSRVNNAHAAEVSHMLFGMGFKSQLGSLYATHPPLEERIHRIEKGARSAPSRPERAAPAPARPAEAVAGVSSLAGAAPPATAPEETTAVASVGNPTPAHVEYARRLRDELPERARDAAHEAYSARALVYALLLNEETGPRAVQMEHHAKHADAAVVEETKKLAPVIDELDPHARLPLIDLALPALGEMSTPQYVTFQRNVTALIRADERIDVFEWTLGRIILRHLAPRYTKVRPRAVQYYALAKLSDPCAALLSTLAYVGHADAEQARAAFDRGAGHLDVDLELLPVDACSLRTLEQALDPLATVSPNLKRQLLVACAATVSADEQITIKEGELFRAIADSLDCPVPPLLPGQPLL